MIYRVAFGWLCGRQPTLVAFKKKKQQQIIQMENVKVQFLEI